MRKMLVVVLLSLCTFSNAQTYLNATGSPTFSTPSSVELGYINIANGNLHLQVPFGSWPQRGAIGLTAGMVYDSRIWQIVNNQWQPLGVPNSMAGWRFATSVDAGSVSFNDTVTSCGSGNLTTYSSFVWTAPDGTQHPFPITTSQNVCTGQNVTSGNAFAADSSGYHMYVTNYTSATVYAKNGNKVSPTSEDTNGNFFSTDANGNVKDTLGRVPVTKSTGVNQIFYDVPNSQGTLITAPRYTVNTQNIIVSTAFGQSGVSEYSGSITAVSSIQLPDGSSYGFGYDSSGEVNSITLRTGGSITYSYTNYSDSYGNINRWATQRVSAGGTWNYTPAVISTCSSGQIGCQQKITLTKPSGDDTVYTFTLNNGAWNTQVQSYTGSSGSGTLLRTIATAFDFSNACVLYPSCPGASYVRPTQVNITDPVPGSSIIKQTTYAYDSIYYGNVNARKEWRYYSGSPAANPDREIDTTYLTASSYLNKDIVDRPADILVKDGSGTRFAETQYSYDDAGSLTLQAGDANHDDANYGTSFTTRGNPTKMLHWVSGAGCSPNTLTCLTTSQGFSTEGTLLSVTDPKGNISSYSYADTFYNDDGTTSPPAVTPNPPTHAYLHKITYANSETVLRYYYFASGKPAKLIDENNSFAYRHYIDPVDRLTATREPALANGTSFPWTIYSYPTTSPFTTVDLYTGITTLTPGTNCTGCRHDITSVDTYGRLSRKTLVSDPEGGDFTDTSYDTTGRVSSVSNPYRTTTDPTYGIESIQYDGLDRQTRNTHQDSNYKQTIYGAAVSGSGGAATQLCSSTTYGLGYPLLKIDEAGKKTQTWSDGFGRNIETDEPDFSGSLTVATCYKYDVLDNLIQIDEGSQHRTYLYDGLSRQYQATEPESGVTNTSYTASPTTLCSGLASNPCSITDARNITATLNYDSRDRLTGKSYSDTTPAVSYAYGNSSCNGVTQTFGLNRRTCMMDGSGTTEWTYDAFGNIASEKRTVNAVSPSVTKTTSLSYNLDRTVATKTYPSGNVITYTYSNAQRLLSVVNNGNGVKYAQSATYTPDGQLTGMLNGKTNTFGGITLSRTYNNRLQLTSSVASSSNGTPMSLSYSYDQGGGVNNGDLVSLNNNKTGQSGRSVAYTYDALNRIASATTSGSNCVPLPPPAASNTIANWGQSFSYDRYGNLLTVSVTKCSAPSPSYTVDPATNHISGMAYGYDAAGNMTSDGQYSNITFDAENRLTHVNSVDYIHDGDDWRIKKSNGELEWHDYNNGNLLDVFDLSGTLKAEYYYIGGFLFASRSFYYYGDNLNSIRVITDTTGNIQRESDYYAFGGELQINNTLADVRKFTSKKRDTESGYDYAHLRPYNATIARWGSSDPIAGDITQPQSLNAYGYVSDNPATHKDSTGAYQDDGDDSRDFVERVPNDAHGAAPVCSGYASNGAESFRTIEVKDVPCDVVTMIDNYPDDCLLAVRCSTSVNNVHVVAAGDISVAVDTIEHVCQKTISTCPPKEAFKVTADITATSILGLPFGVGIGETHTSINCSLVVGKPKGGPKFFSHRVSRPRGRIHG